ncbi:SDR family NAD(P)-dependent oxidoreductase [Maribacter litopenaei]|uniref:SDR family NAD(P)-dependent oxidoreductase n=1 Tax=Maribacter litopenaei TaxID=2976127 RepID=UPI0030845F3C
MNISLQGKKALIGGSSGGIGKAIAMQLAESGASVTLMSRSENKLKEIVAHLPTDKGQAHQYLKVDFSDFTSFQKIIEDYFDNNFVDILVNNTQGPTAGTALEKKVQITRKPSIYSLRLSYLPRNLPLKE